MSERELELTPSQTLAFFASVIKSGEPWTATCQKAYDEAQAALTASRQSILEEAAKVAEADNTPAYGSDNQAMEWLAHRQRQNIAAAIRSLSQAPDKEGEAG